MGGSPNLISCILAACLAVSLCACGGRAGTEPETGAPPEAAASGGSAASFDIPGEDAREIDEGPQAVTDGLEGSYYNDYLRMTLMLDGSGFCTLTGDGGGAAGTYRPTGDGGLLLKLDAGEDSAVIDADGDITIEGRAGYFLRDWDFWGITPAEAGVAAASAAPRTGLSDNGDGTYRFRDYENGIAFTYPAGMTVRRDGPGGGVAVTGGGGAVTGRNVTALYSTHSGSDDEFLEDYVKTFVFADFELLYGEPDSYDGLTVLHEDIEGRLAAAALRLKSARDDLAAKVIFYTSTYGDGTVNYICKTVFSPAEQDSGPDALADIVSNMSAVRLIQDET